MNSLQFQGKSRNIEHLPDITRFAGGFTPQLSVGQFRSREAHALCARLQATWQPLAFTLSHVYLIWRNDPPDDVFRTGPVLSLEERTGG